MKEEKYLELLKENKLEELKSLLENNIRDSIAIKSNSRSRISALKRIIKSNSARPALQGYGFKDGKYYFTDSYCMIAVNDSAEFDEQETFPLESLVNIQNRWMDSKEKLYITPEDLMYHVKTKENYKNDYFKKDTHSVEFDYKFIKNAFDILGGKVEIFTNSDKTALILINDKNESVGILGLILK